MLLFGKRDSSTSGLGQSMTLFITGYLTARTAYQMFAQHLAKEALVPGGPWVRHGQPC